MNKAIKTLQIMLEDTKAERRIANNNGSYSYAEALNSKIMHLQENLIKELEKELGL